MAVSRTGRLKRRRGDRLLRRRPRRLIGEAGIWNPSAPIVTQASTNSNSPVFATRFSTVSKTTQAIEELAGRWVRLPMREKVTGMVVTAAGRYVHAGAGALSAV